MKDDPKGSELLEKLAREVPVKPNPRGIPSLWYMPLIGAGNFFDGLGFAPYVERFGWKPIPTDEREVQHPPQNPLLPFLEKLSQEIPEALGQQAEKIRHQRRLASLGTRVDRGGRRDSDEKPDATSLTNMLHPKRTVAELKELHALTGDESGAQRVAFTGLWAGGARVAPHENGGDPRSRDAPR